MTTNVRGVGVRPLGWRVGPSDPEDVLILGRLGGTAVDELARFHQLDDYVAERVDASGVAEVTDTEAGCASVSWQMRLTDG
ncbi:hypothetical protein [Micromonospora luteifusca]|uniref:hypothetical protein n=1 Tax=Micromonospora luteifusca TaxID=709860 RepID=UPI0033B9562B